VKKKLITALGIITLIFIVSGTFIFANLRLVASQQRLRDSQDRVLDDYSDVMIYLRSAQAELYRHEAGYSRDIDGLAENVLKVEDALTAIKKGYGSLNAASCNKCHEVASRVAALRMRLSDASDHLRKYEDKISLIATSRDARLEGSWENEATEEGNRLLDIIAGAAEATARMNRHMDKLQLVSLKRSGFSIFIAIILSALLSLAVITLTIRSIRDRLRGLISGIERVSSGDYSSKVNVGSGDEIGFLAKAFNAMTDNLDRTTSQRNLLEAELRELNNTLEKRITKATEELKRTHEQMLRTETLSAVGTLASGVAHELATPLSSVLNYVRLIKKRNDAGDGTAAEMDIIERELVRCRDILRGMLSFARAPEKEKIAADINGILHQVVELTRPQTRSRRISVRENLDASLPSIPAISGQLRQVFLNVIMNAIQSMPWGGELEVTTSLIEQGRKVAVRISDTGSGIPGSDMNRIFDPFFTSKKEGTGLGLSISYGIVKGHGGDIEVESEEGRGTTFTISLPVKQ
jgi:two-component system, NtrC family, sensor kinase